jgi:hypothetical protein
MFDEDDDEEDQHDEPAVIREPDDDDIRKFESSRMKVASGCDPHHSDSANKRVHGVVSIHGRAPMPDLAARSRKINLPVPSISITVVCLFCLLGLAITAAIVPMIPLEDISWVLSNNE